MVIIKKRWYQIMAPPIFNGELLGETPCSEPKTLPGKTLRVNLASLTNDMRRQNTEISLIMDKVEGDKIRTSVIGVRILPTSIRRLVRKGRSRIDETIRAVTKDDKIVTIKALLLTRTKVKSSVAAELDGEVKRFVIKRVSTVDYEELADAVITGMFQKEIKDRLKKIFPLKMGDIKEFKLERSLTAADIKLIKANLLKQIKKPSRVKEESKEEEIEEKAEEDSQSEENPKEENTKDESEEKEDTKE
jgi:ribosomal protein S3AE